MKTVSVLIACYNAELYLEKCLLSLFQQTLHNFEIIIVDDGSTDNSVQLINKICSGRNNVIFIPRQENLGVIKTRNELLEFAQQRSEYIAWCDADDIYHKNKLKLQYDFLKNNNEFLGCGTWYKKFGLNNRIIIKFVNPLALKIFTCFGSPVGFPTFMHKNNLGIYFNERLESSEDYQFVSDIAMQGKLTNIRKVLTFYRVHKSQESTKNNQRQLKVHHNIASACCLAHLAYYEKLHPTLLEPLITDIKTYDQIISMLSSLQDNIFDKTLASILDYRVLVYNKKNFGYLIKYIIKRGFRLLNIYKLYIR